MDLPSNPHAGRAASPLGRQHPPRVGPASRNARALPDADRELLNFNVRLAKQRQGLLDCQRIERKAFREHARVENAVAAYTRELAALLRQRSFSRHRPRPLPASTGDSVLVVQLSDLHFNERVELPSNPGSPKSQSQQPLARLSALGSLGGSQCPQCPTTTLRQAISPHRMI